MVSTIKIITNNNLCIGCGLCRLACPIEAIELHWSVRKIWQADIDQRKCNNCSACFKVCPQKPEQLVEQMLEAKETGIEFGMQRAHLLALGRHCSAVDANGSASGGLLSYLLGELLRTQQVDAVITVCPVPSRDGESHFETCLIENEEQLNQARGSHYQFVSYDTVLKEALTAGKTVAIVGAPCVLRGVELLPDSYRHLIVFKLSLACSHNATAAFADCLAAESGVAAGETFLIRFRDKFGVAKHANFNNTFETSSSFKRTCRFKNSFTRIWRRYFFSHDACLYCPDFFGVNADASFKDAWGLRAECSTGNSIIVVRNTFLVALFRKASERGAIKLVELSEEEFQPFVQKSQFFKHCQTISRSYLKKCLWVKIPKTKRCFHLPSVIQGAYYLANIRMSRILSFVNVIRIAKFIEKFSIVPRRSISILIRIKNLVELLFQFVLDRFHIYLPSKFTEYSDIVICGGYGYGNVGDEVQLAANLCRWRVLAPEKKVTVLTPNIDFTQKIHGDIDVDLAPRRSFYGYRGRDYAGSWDAFRLIFMLLAPLLLCNAWFLKFRLPLLGLTKGQARTLCHLSSCDALFLSGGGYLTGKTRSRLWDHMLLLQLAKILGTKTIVSGQTIGVLESFFDRYITRWAIKDVDILYLRDREGSPVALRELGIQFNLDRATIDDGLFYRGFERDVLSSVISGKNTLLPDKYIVVNVHFWKQAGNDSSKIIHGFAEALDQLIDEFKLPVVFVAMHPSDAYAANEVRLSMNNDSSLVNMCDNIDATVGALQNAFMCITMKHHPIIFSYTAGIPVVSVVLDDYYYHKNMGAHKLFGQERYVVSSADILVDEVVGLSKEIISDRQNISCRITQKAEELKIFEGAAIKEYISLGRNL